MTTLNTVKTKALGIIDKCVDEHQFIGADEILNSILDCFDLVNKQVATYGDKVMVLNYRKNPAEYERGTVRRVSYDGYKNELRWSYFVILDRVSGKGLDISLSVGEDSIYKY